MNYALFLISILFFFSLITPEQLSATLQETKQKKNLIESQISHLLLEEMKSLSFAERIWISKQNLTYKQLSAKQKHSSKIKDGLEKIIQISRKLSSPQAEVPFFSRSTQKHPPFSLNEVVSSNQRYIITESPRQETLNIFWNTLLDNKVQLLITLVSPQEEGKNNLSLFWKKEEFPFFIGDWKIDALGEGIFRKSDKEKTKQLVSRLFLAQNKRTGQSRVIQQLHYVNWPEGAQPDNVLLERLIALTIQLNPDREKKLLVHCANGMGRSGTFVTAHSLCKEIWDAHNRFKLKKTPINAAEKLILFRMQRPHLVSTQDQYESIYQTVGFYIKRLKKDGLINDMAKK